jgi:hypothetical protein
MADIVAEALIDNPLVKVQRLLAASPIFPPNPLP